MSQLPYRPHVLVHRAQHGGRTGVPRKQLLSLETEQILTNRLKSRRELVGCNLTECPEGKRQHTAGMVSRQTEPNTGRSMSSTVSPLAHS